MLRPVPTEKLKTTVTLKIPSASLLLCAFALSFCFLTACSSGADSSAFQATLPPTVSNAPIYTATPSFTPSPTLTFTPTPTLTPTLTVTPSPTASSTPTLSPTPTMPLLTLTPVSNEGAPASVPFSPADFAPTAGWSCEDFPCEDDIQGFLERIHVPTGFVVEHVGQFPGAPMQITYGPDGRLYATVLENGTRDGAVYAMNADGTTQRYSGDLISPVGLAFQPETDVLYVTARVSPTQGGGLYRIPPGGGEPEVVIADLPCCYSLIDNQPNGIIFGPDGYLYMGIGSLTDHAESATPRTQPYAEILPDEAAVLRIQPHTGEIEPYAAGLHNPYDVTFDADGQFYATDSGLVTGQGDRLLAVDEGAHYGWPYWRARGCAACPLEPSRLDVMPDLFTFPDLSLPRGLVAYTGSQFPANYFGSLFVALWNGTSDAQRIVCIDPHDPRLGTEDYTPEPFVTGLIRPIDVTIAPDGSLVVADFIYGHVWRISYQ
jgi:glucose/arabinose dehydrogenase